MITPASRLAHIQEYYFSQKLKQIAELNAAGQHILNLGIGSPDLPPSADTITALTQAAALTNTHAYQSYVGVPALRKAFADFYQRHYHVSLDPNSEILPLLGSKEGIMHIAMTYLEAGDEALIPNPGYPTYRAAVTLTGATVREYRLSETTDWLPDLDALAQTDLRRVKLMFVNYPNMPTGAKADKAFFQRLIDFAKTHQILLINDNPYSFILNASPTSMLDTDGWREVALELNSLSKSHNMAGWRVGALVGSAAHLADVLRFKSNMDSGMFLPVQLAAVAALNSDADWYTTLNATYRVRQQQVFTLLTALGCTFDAAQTGLFVWAKVPPKFADGYALSDAVL